MMKSFLIFLLVIIFFFLTYGGEPSAGRIAANRERVGIIRELHQTSLKNAVIDIQGTIIDSSGKKLDNVNLQARYSRPKDIWETKNETASRVRMRLEAVINWAIRHKYRKLANPATWRGNLEFDLPPVAKVKHVKHHSSMTFEEAKQVVSYLLDHPSVVSAAILFGLATAARVNEFRFAKWEEIDGDTWYVPPERRKDSKTYPHRVPLNQLAKTALSMVDGKKHSEFIFVNGRGNVIALDSPRLKLIDILKKRVTMHGCRSTFSDWCAENGKDPVLREKSLIIATDFEQSDF